MRRAGRFAALRESGRRRVAVVQGAEPYVGTPDAAMRAGGAAVPVYGARRALYPFSSETSEYGRDATGDIGDAAVRDAGPLRRDEPASTNDS